MAGGRKWAPLAPRAGGCAGCSRCVSCLLSTDQVAVSASWASPHTAEQHGTPRPYSPSAFPGPGGELPPAAPTR